LTATAVGLLADVSTYERVFVIPSITVSALLM